jgi:hypothetical protein
MFWPTVSVRPKYARFTFRNSSHVFSVKNSTNDDVYLVVVNLEHWNPDSEMTIIGPTNIDTIGSSPAKAVGLTISGSDGRVCTLLEFRKLESGEELKIQVESRTDKAFDIAANISSYSKEEQGILSAPNSAGMPLTTPDKCE